MSENVPGINPATIKIKKNYGITHALKDLVDEMVKNKKAELTDGKITAEEWNAVMDKLIELQQNRKAEGKASIFTGGTDKTKAGWHNSFIVHPDQQIEFTAEETAQLYEAMGVKLTGTPAENQEAKETPAPEEKTKANENPGAKETPAPEEKTKANENPGAKETPAPEEKPNEGTPGPNGTIVKNGEYYAKDGTKLNPNYARGTEMKFENGVSARVFDDGSKVAYRDKDGKSISVHQFMKENPNEYIVTLNQQLINYAGEEALKGLSVDPDPDKNGKLDGKMEFTINGKTIKAGLPVNVENVMKLFGIPQRKIEQPAPEQTQQQAPPDTAPADSTATQTPPVNENPEVKGSEKPEEKPKAEEKPANPAQNPPAAGTPQERLAANPYAKATEPPEGITAKQGKDANNDDCEIWTDQNGREVKRIYDKGDANNEYCAVIEYDNNGKKTAELETAMGSDRLDIERLYDENGTLRKETSYNLDGTVYYIEEQDSNGNTTKYTKYQGDGKTVDYTDTFKYNDDGSYTKTRTLGDDTVDYIEEKDSQDRRTKYTKYKEDGKTVDFTDTYTYNDDGSLTRKQTRGDGTVYYIQEKDSKDRITKSTYYKEDGKTVDYNFTYTYNDKDGSKTITSTRGDGTVAYIGEYDKDGNKPKETYYKEDGKTVDRLVENGVLRLTHIKSKNSDGIERDYKFEFDENGVCTKSVLADSLHHIISGPTLNRDTIALLEYINPENVIKVLTSYEAVAGQSLVQALKEEWFMGEEPIQKHIYENLSKRLEQLGIKDETIDFSNPEFVKKLAKLDNEKTK